MLNRSKSAATLFVQMGQDQLRYLCATTLRDRNRPQSLSVLDFGESESGQALEDVVQELASRKLKPRNLVLLLPRSEFEVHLYQLPDVEENDIPAVIANLVSESMDTLDFATDFLINTREPDGKNALTWTLENRAIQDFRNEAKQNGLSLACITSHAVGSISLWRNLVQTRSSHAVIVTIANRAIDFSVIYNQELTHIRSIPFPQENVEQVTTRLISELQRTVAITGDSGDSESTRIYLFGAPESRKPIAEALTEEFDVPVSILNPIDNTEFTDKRLTVSDSENYAHLIGAAKAHFFDRLDVDLISPRQATKKTLPWRRIAVWSFLAVALLGSGSYVLWDAAAAQREEIAEKRRQFDELAPDARRVIEMKDELAAIRAWRQNEVVWLDELDELSRRLPPREQSLIRRISMTASEKGAAKVDLAVEVTDNSLVVGLEESIRSENNKVTSKRVSESSDLSGERWNFETSIQFSVKPPKLSFVDEVPNGEDKSKGTAKQSKPDSNSQTQKEAGK